MTSRDFDLHGNVAQMGNDTSLRRGDEKGRSQAFSSCGIHTHFNVNAIGYTKTFPRRSRYGVI